MCPVHMNPTVVSNGLNSCEGCGEYVSEGFVRVFGDNEGRVEHCPSCAISTDYGESRSE